MTGYVDLSLFGSESSITVSKTAILFVEENLSNTDIVNIHCVGGITHTVSSSFEKVRQDVPKFVSTQRKDNGQPKVLVHDWNISYVEKGGDGNAIIYFTEPGVNIVSNDPYADIIQTLHSL